MRKYLKKIVSNKSLTESEAYECMLQILSGKSDDILIAAFLASLATKGESSNEISGFAKAMREQSIPIKIPNNLKVVDSCGTGGDRFKTFNISTAAAIVASAAGVPIAKHGNRSVTSKCGSADILEAAGVKLNLPPEKVSKCIEKIGIGFIFAQEYHPAMKNVMPIRQKLGIRTVFNILGPLTSPARAPIQLLGVFDPKYVEKIANALKKLGSERSMVIHGFDENGNPAIDEISNAGLTLAAILDDGKIKIKELYPEDFGVERREIKLIEAPNSIDKSLKIFYDVLKGKDDTEKEKARLEVTLINTSALLYLAGTVKDFEEGTEIAREIVKEGKALKN